MNYPHSRSNYSATHSKRNSSAKFCQVAAVASPSPEIERSAKRFLNSPGQRETKRAKILIESFSEKAASKQEQRKVWLLPSTLILASGLPGKATEHQLLTVKFQTHPFIRPRVQLNNIGDMINFEIIKVTTQSLGQDRPQCEFSVGKQDIASIVTFVGEKIPEGITNKVQSAQEATIVLSDDVGKMKKNEQSDVQIDPDTIISDQLTEKLKTRKPASRGLKVELNQRLKKDMQDTEDTEMLEGTIKQKTNPVALCANNKKNKENKLEDKKIIDRRHKSQFKDIVDDELPVKKTEKTDQHITEKIKLRKIHELESKNTVEEIKRETIVEEKSEKTAEKKGQKKSPKEVPVEATGKTLKGVVDDVDADEQKKEPSLQFNSKSGNKENDKDAIKKKHPLEDCLVYVSGFRGKIAKKALLEAFGKFGTIVEMKQVAKKKCRIRYMTPREVSKLLNCVPPFEFNGRTLNIRRKLNSRKKKKFCSGKKSKESTKKVKMAKSKNEIVWAERIEDLENEIEIGRGTSDVPKVKNLSPRQKESEKTSRTNRKAQTKGKHRWTMKWAEKQGARKAKQNWYNKNKPPSASKQVEKELGFINAEESTIGSVERPGDFQNQESKDLKSDKSEMNGADKPLEMKIEENHGMLKDIERKSNQQRKLEVTSEVKLANCDSFKSIKKDDISEDKSAIGVYASNVELLTEKIESSMKKLESQFKENINLQDGLAMHASLRTKSTKQLNQDKPMKSFVETWEIAKPIADAVVASPKDEAHSMKQDEVIKESETLSYRVVIALKNPPRLLKISNDLLS